MFLKKATQGNILTLKHVQDVILLSPNPVTSQQKTDHFQRIARPAVYIMLQFRVIAHAATSAIATTNSIAYGGRYLASSLSSLAQMNIAPAAQSIINRLNKKMASRGFCGFGKLCVFVY